MIEEWLEQYHYIEKSKIEESVQFRPRGNSRIYRCSNFLA